MPYRFPVIVGDVLFLKKTVKITEDHYKTQKSLELSNEGSRLLKRF